MLPLVEFTNMTTCRLIWPRADSIDFSVLDFQNTSSHTYDFEIPLKGFKLPVIVDLVAATWFHQFLIVDLLIRQMLIELEGT